MAVQKPTSGRFDEALTQIMALMHPDAMGRQVYSKDMYDPSKDIKAWTQYLKISEKIEELCISIKEGKRREGTATGRRGKRRKA